MSGKISQKSFKQKSWAQFWKQNKTPACASSNYLSAGAHAGIYFFLQNCAQDFCLNDFCEIFPEILIPCL